MLSGRSVAAALAGVLTLTGPAVADTHDDGIGRLSANSGSGGFIAHPPVHRPYWITSGEWILCDTAAGDSASTETIVITGVRHITGKAKPLEIRTYLRTVTPEQVASHPDSPRGAYSPFGSKVGRPAHFGQKYADQDWKPLGHYRRDFAGTPVTDGCDQALADSEADAHDEVPVHAWTSLVLAVKVGRDAGRVRRTLVDYVVGEDPHTLRIRWVVGGQGYERH